MAHLAAQQGPNPLMITTVQPKNMTITERNQKLYDLRVKMDDLNAQLAWVKQEIWLANEQYDRENRTDLFTEMFGDDN